MIFYFIFFQYNLFPKSSRQAPLHLIIRRGVTRLLLKQYTISTEGETLKCIAMAIQAYSLVQTIVPLILEANQNSIRLELNASIGPKSQSMDI